jgi:hypothetical protein
MQLKSMQETHVDEGKVRDHGLDLTDNLGLRCSVEGFEFHIENSLLLRFLLFISISINGQSMCRICFSPPLLLLRPARRQRVQLKRRA